MTEDRREEKNRMGWLPYLLLSLGILALAVGAALWILSSEPTSQPSGATKKTAMLVETVPVERGSYEPKIEAIGQVEPALEIQLSPRVSGQIIRVSDNFIPGESVQKGELLLEIDPADYEAALQQKLSQLRNAKAQLELEMGRQDVAAAEYDLLGEELRENNKELVLRKPHLNAARAEVESARAAVRKARLDLQRTRVVAPFDAQVLERTVNQGSQVAPGESLGRLVGNNEYWVIATLPLSKLPWIKIPEDERQKGAKVRLRDRTGWREDFYREGYIKTLIGTLDEKTRLARLLISVPNPTIEKENTPPLILGQLLHLRIEGRKLNQVIQISRDYVRESDNVWVMKDGKLDIREVDIAFKDAESAYIREGLGDGERVITTSLATVTEGAPLRTQNQTESERSPAGTPESEEESSQ